MATPISHFDPIERVVLLMLENHSFDQMLGSLSSVYPELDGVRQSGEPYSNMDEEGNVYRQNWTAELQMSLDPDHDNGPVLRQLANGNSGFVKDFIRKYPSSAPSERQQIMAFYEFPFLPALHTLADNFVVCDRWFSSLPGPTWPNRFFALSGTSHGHVRMPESILDPDVEGFFEQTQDTLFDRLNEASRTWRVYHYGVASSWVLVHQRRPENFAKYKAMDFFFDDVAKGDLPDFVFVEPKYYGHDQNDDHPPHNIMKAEKLIADVYNAIRTSPLWEKTLLVVVYDEHGGFFDHVTPPPTVAPDEYVKEFAFDQFGVRVPAILISPWLDRGFDHTEFDHTSLLRYLTDKWGLGPLGKRVANANSIALAMRFLSHPRQDTVPTVRVRNSDLYAPHPELEEFDRSAHHQAFRAFRKYLARRRVLHTGGVPPPGEPSVFTWTRSLLGTFRDSIGRQLIHWGTTLSTSKLFAASETTQLVDEVIKSSSADE